MQLQKFGNNLLDNEMSIYKSKLNIPVCCSSRETTGLLINILRRNKYFSFRGSLPWNGLNSRSQQTPNCLKHKNRSITDNVWKVLQHLKLTSTSSNIKPFRLF